MLPPICSAFFLMEESPPPYYNYRYYNPADGRWINRVQSLQKEDGICMGLLIMKWYSLLIISEKKLTNLATQ